MRQLAGLLAGLAMLVCLGGCKEKAGEPEAQKAAPPAAEKEVPAKALPDVAESVVADSTSAAPQPAEDVAAESPEAAAPDAAQEVAEAREVTVSVGRLNKGPEAPLGTVDVRFTLPAGWQDRPGFGEATFGPVESAAIPTQFSLRATCAGQCSPAVIDQNLAGALAAFRQRAERPNFNTGNPKLDAVRAEVKELAAPELSGGKGIALAVDYADELKANGPYQPQFQVFCGVHRPGDDFFVSLSGRGPLPAAERWAEPMLGICKSLTILGPTVSEPEGRPAVTVEGERLTLQAIPISAYEVVSELSGKPSVIELKQPIAFKNLSVAPIGRIYLETNDDPLTLRDVYFVEDVTFAMPDAGIAGDQVSCLRRNQVRINGEAGLRRCTLAADLVVGAATLPAYTEVEFAEGRFRRGTLADETTYAEATCMGGKSVTMDPANGGLVRCVLATPLVVGDVAVPAGADVKWEEVAQLRTIHLPPGTELKVGEEVHPGPGTASFSNGKLKRYRPAN